MCSAPVSPGLSATLTLQAAGARVRVLEVQDRPGGRLRTESGGGLTIDVGAVEVDP
ncbi:MAG: FAD-dependent oxidoreductase [Alphaproteobacteria bacterium]|uniref:FAD-dependent oxidoreductase n=1 Tax=Brevundimonas sp. TaxID=1871086 RepID=UPI00391CB7FC